VVGFDDIQSAAIQNPALTTVRQPLQRNGSHRGRDVMDASALPVSPRTRNTITIEPEFIVRASTASVET